MHRMPVSADIRGHPCVDRFDEQLKIFNAGFGKDTVSEVEDVAEAAVGASQHVARPLPDQVGRPEQHRGVEVSLDASVVPDSLPSLVERHTPVQRDDVRARACDGLQQAGGIGPEVDPGHSEWSKWLEYRASVLHDGM